MLEEVLRRIVLAALIPAAVVATMAGPAHAAPSANFTPGDVGKHDHECPPIQRGGAANGSYDRVTGIVKAVDNCADGHSGVFQYKVNGNTFSVWATGGKGSSGSAGTAIRSGTKVSIRACVGESGSRAIFGCWNWYSVTV